MSEAACIVIVCPASASSNNGNWRTAARWQSLLRSAGHRVRIVQQWPDAQAARDSVMLALHAHKSAAAIAAWHQQRGPAGLGVVLTGTDLYPDISQDALALRSLDQAHSLVVLQAQALAALPPAHRARARVILQSSRTGAHQAGSGRWLRVLVVGHLREEKNPDMLWRAVRRLHAHEGIRITHIGQALAPHWAQQAQAVQAQCPHYRWVPGLTHAQTLRRIASADLLVHPSRSEGGALVIAEAITRGTPVLASRIAGNVGVLGPDYAGLVEVDDDAALAEALRRCRMQQGQPQGPLAQWWAQCAARAPQFAPATEQAALVAWVRALQDDPSRTPA